MSKVKRCPRCGGKHIVKAGKLIRTGGPKQASQCADCAYRAEDAKFCTQ